MKVPYDEGVANHIGPESCGHAREGMHEALTGENAGWAIEPRNERLLSSADDVWVCGRPHQLERYRKSQLNSARSENQSTHGSSLHGNREILVSTLRDGSKVCIVNPKGVRQ